MLETILLFIIILGVLVFVHEGGHFVAAKLSGVRVDEFGLGFPPRLFAHRRGETEYTINALPFGGFVRVFGEDGRIPDASSLTGEHDTRSFALKSFSAKMQILFAGVAMNWILAAVLFGILQVIGAPVSVPDDEAAPHALVTIADVSRESPAALSGLVLGDTILALRSSDAALEHPQAIADVQSFIQTHRGKDIELLVQRNRETRTVHVTPRENPPKGEGALGVSLLRVASVAYPWYEALWRGFFVAVSLTFSLFAAFGDIAHDFFVDQRVTDGLAGPVGIAVLTGDALSLGVVALLNFIAILSLNLAILNALPFPALDGGRVALIVVEGFLRRPLPARGVAWMHALGFALLIAFVIAITVRDVRNLL